MNTILSIQCCRLQITVQNGLSFNDYSLRSASERQGTSVAIVIHQWILFLNAGSVWCLVTVTTALEEATLKTSSLTYRLHHHISKLIFNILTTLLYYDWSDSQHIKPSQAKQPTTLCLKKPRQLWNGIAQNYNNRFWWNLAEIFKRL